MPDSPVTQGCLLLTPSLTSFENPYLQPKLSLESQREATRLRYSFCFLLKSIDFWFHLTFTEFALTFTCEVDPLISTYLWGHGTSLKSAVSLQIPVVLDHLEQTSVVRLTLATKSLKGFQVLKPEKTLSK